MWYRVYIGNKKYVHLERKDILGDIDLKNKYKSYKVIIGTDPKSKKKIKKTGQIICEASK